MLQHGPRSAPQQQAAARSDAAAATSLAPPLPLACDRRARVAAPLPSPPAGLQTCELYGKFTWRLEKFGESGKRELRSNVFEVGGYKWCASGLEGGGVRRGSRGRAGSACTGQRRLQQRRRCSADGSSAAGGSGCAA
jgi:hypothetical protein